MDDIAYLITDLPGAHGVHDTPEQAERMIYVRVMSVGRSEYYNAHNAGLQPEVVFKLTDAADYNDERRARYQDVKYDILRSYRTPDGGVELTLQRSDVG